MVWHEPNQIGSENQIRMQCESTLISVVNYFFTKPGCSVVLHLRYIYIYTAAKRSCCCCCCCCCWCWWWWWGWAGGGGVGGGGGGGWWGGGGGGGGGVGVYWINLGRLTVWRRDGLWSITQVCFRISISTFICMSFVAMRWRLLILSNATFKMAACRYIGFINGILWRQGYPQNGAVLELSIWHRLGIYFIS